MSNTRLISALALSAALSVFVASQSVRAQESGVRAGTTITVDGFDPAVSVDLPAVQVNLASADYFQVMGIRLLRGRTNSRDEFFVAHGRTSTLTANADERIEPPERLRAVGSIDPDREPAGHRAGTGRRPIDLDQIAGPLFRPLVIDAGKDLVWSHHIERLGVRENKKRNAQRQ